MDAMALQRHLFLVTTVVMTLFGGSYSAAGAGKRYAVGDTLWSIPPYPDFYTHWSSSHFFYIGDSLVFDFETEVYNVMQVPKLDYDSCTSNNPIKILNAGPAIIILNEEGVFYYTCNMSNYCALGQKISVTVNKSPASLPPTPSLSPLLSPVPSTRSSSEPCRPPAPSLSEWNRSESPVPVSSPLLPSNGNGNSSSKAVSVLEHSWGLSVVFSSVLMELSWVYAMGYMDFLDTAD